LPKIQFPKVGLRVVDLRLAKLDNKRIMNINSDGTLMVILLSPSSISSSSNASVSRHRFVGLGDGLGDLRLGTSSDFNCGGGARGA
jgi:hypothetical protein